MHELYIDPIKTQKHLVFFLHKIDDNPFRHIFRRGDWLVGDTIIYSGLLELWQKGERERICRNLSAGVMDRARQTDREDMLMLDVSQCPQSCLSVTVHVTVTSTTSDTSAIKAILLADNPAPRTVRQEQP